MDIKEKAKMFAINAHMGQVRKSELDKPMIIHPISVGELLESFGYDDHVIAAGYLHDVVEDTKYTIADIEKYFGSDIATLVMNASEPDKTLSWEERKKHTIAEIKKLPLRSKLVICADKINNLEDLFLVINADCNGTIMKFSDGTIGSIFEQHDLFNRVRKLIERDKNKEVIKNIFNGKELMEFLNISQGKEVGKAVNIMLELQDEFGCDIDKEEAKKMIKERFLGK